MGNGCSHDGLDERVETLDDPKTEKVFTDSALLDRKGKSHAAGSSAAAASGGSPSSGPASSPPNSPGPSAFGSPAIRATSNIFEEAGSNDDVAVVLAWSLSFSGQGNLDKSLLAKLNDHIANCCALFGTSMLMDEATSGLIQGRPLVNDNMNAQDTAVRLGQLVCRWGASHKIRLRVGVAMGSLRSITVGSGRMSYFGSSCAMATQLALISGQDLMVHMSNQVKENLSALRLMRVMISPSHLSYYLDPATTVPTYFQSHRADDHNADTLALSMKLERTVDSPDGGGRSGVMSLTDFVALLQKYQVDTSKFGQGMAKSIEDFYDAVVKEQKSNLVVAEDDVLERVVNLVRISLRIRDSDNKLRELRIQSQKSDGGTRLRNQPLAVVLKMPEQGQWQEAIEKCFEEKLQIPTRAQKMCFSMDHDSYSVQEEKSSSETIPGIMTTYKSHNIIVNIKDKAHKELRVLGLPMGTSFELGNKTWTWAPVEDSREDELMGLLQKHGIDVSDFAPQAFAELYEEVYGKLSASLDVQNGELVRTIRIIKVWLHADILNVDHVLVVKAKWQKGQFDAMVKDTPISMRMGVDQQWSEALEASLLTRLGLTESFQAAHLAVDRASHKLTEEVGYSRSYPGLKTIYMVNEVSVHVLHSAGGPWQFIGLPSGTDFTFARREAVKGPETEDVVITHWCWKMRDEMEQRENRFMRKSVNSAPSISDEDCANDDPEESHFVSCSEEEVLKHRVPSPEPLEVGTAGVNMGSPIGALEKLMQGMKTDWKRAKKAADRMRDPKYSCKDFHDDIVAAFPELRLYCVKQGSEESRLTISGRTADDEYQRTLGAMFALFWIMRLDLGGKESFCFGLDKSWKPLNGEAQRVERDAEEKKRRKAFLETTNWSVVKDLLVDAKLLSEGSRGLAHDPERTLAMLVLLAIHDIMKMSALTPRVSADVNEFHGYKMGEPISDHDVALSYVLTHHAQVLPSYSGLSRQQRQSVHFTHCKIDYNMGWLVQAEAPPGALFKTFKKVIKEGQAPSCDVAFYFVHWFCDLAAAEPVPFEGCEKFVLKFPQRVLAQFLDSFSVVNLLGSSKTETEVLEEYFNVRWLSEGDKLGPLPMGRGAIAQLRVILMAQGDSAAVVQALIELPPEDSATLSEELALTGIRDQTYAKDPACGSGRGPAILVYYSPALMQRAGRKDARGALIVLAEVFRQARELWPLSAEMADTTVTVRIDALKELEVSAILRPDSGYAWVLEKTSSTDAMVKLISVATLRNIDFTANQILSFTQNGGNAKKKRGRASLFAPTMARVRRLSLW